MAQAYSPRPLTDGERWTAEALGALRAGRYAPDAYDTTADLAFLTAAGLSARRAGRLPASPACALGARFALGIALSLTAAFGRSRRPAIRARPAGAVLRICGLALCAAERPRAGSTIMTAGCLTPPRSTASHYSRA